MSFPDLDVYHLFRRLESVLGVYWLLVASLACGPSITTHTEKKITRGSGSLTGSISAPWVYHGNCKQLARRLARQQQYVERLIPASFLAVGFVTCHLRGNVAADTETT